MTYPEAIQFLYDLRWFGAKFGLENTLKLAALAGNPQSNLRFIHVAGTNGKGSTCAMLESIYRAAGLRVGLFTSPHLVSFRERIQVNRKPISESDTVRLVSEMRSLLGQGWIDGHLPPHVLVSGDHGHPTFFEVVTVMALRYFAEQKCDLVIWETGLGGRLDATNIVMPLASIITNIQFDHERWLGDTLAKIAFEKAGIIKPGVPVITAAEEPEALDVIREIARQRHSPLRIIGDAEINSSPLDQIQLSLPGHHQKLNAAIANATVEILSPVLPVSRAAVEAGLSGVQWPGRLQVIDRPPVQRILLDGAHNPAGAKALAAALSQMFPYNGVAATRVCLIFGALRDKNCGGICEILAPLAHRILTVPVSSERSAPPQELGQLCRLARPSANVQECASLGEALNLAHSDELVIITGSLYLVGEAIELLQPESKMSANERELNEWTLTTEPQRCSGTGFSPHLSNERVPATTPNTSLKGRGPG